jgi:hypothetical protein
VLEKLRSGEPLTAKEKQIHDQGLVTGLRQIHDELDEAVLEAYGWSDLSAKGTPCSGGLRPSIANEEAAPLSPNGVDAHRAPLQGTSSANDEELLTRLVALNHERAAEEKRGLSRWLRPEYQNPTAKASDGHRPPLQQDLAGTDSDSSSSNPKSKIDNPRSSISPSSFKWSGAETERRPTLAALVRTGTVYCGNRKVMPKRTPHSGPPSGVSR